MAFAIMRVAKIKTFGALENVNNHNTREITTWINEDGKKVDMKHIDKSKKHLNKLRIGSGDPVEDVKFRLEELGISNNIRKNGVLALEFMVSASPEFFNDLDFTEARTVIGDDEESKQLQDKLIKEAKEDNEKLYQDNLNLFCEKAEGWLIEEFGKENVVNCHLHMDESTPHLHVVCLPVVKYKSKAKTKRNDRKYADWKLSAYNFTGGRQKLSELQDRYHSHVEELGLERGKKKIRLEEQDEYTERASLLAKEHKNLKEELSEMGIQLSEKGNQYASLDEDLMDLLKEYRDLQERSVKSQQKAESYINTLGNMDLSTTENIEKAKKHQENLRLQRALHKEIKEDEAKMNQKIKTKIKGFGM